MTDFVECGAGQVLVGLVKRIDREAHGHSVIDAALLVVERIFGKAPGTHGGATGF